MYLYNLMRTTIQLSDELRRNLKVFASTRDISYEAAIEDLMSVFDSVIPFRSESEFAEWFENNLNKFGFKRIIEHRIRSSPDYQVEDAKGNIREVELEINGLDFLRHKHDPSKTDLIICVFSSEKEVLGVPILPIVELSENTSELKRKLIARNHTSVTIPTNISNKIKEFIDNTGFTSVSDYVTYVLREVIANVDSDGKKEAFTKEDEEKVKERLRALGYLD